jgi:hypothetical protein
MERAELMYPPPGPSRRHFLLASGTALLTGRLRADDAVKVPAIDERIKQLATDAPLAMTFRGQTADKCRQWQKEFADKLRCLLGPHTPPARWKTHVERRVELKDHRRDELVLTADGQPPLPVYLLAPLAKASKRRPGLLLYGDVPEIASLIAPRPCVWEVGARDGLIVPKWADQALERMRRAYKALDAADRLHVDRFEGGHQWNGKVAYPLLEKVLG